MPNYIICSNDRNDLGYIHSLNLCPWFSTTYATIQVQTLNTQANFQILTTEDFIEFFTAESGEVEFLCKLSLGDQQGCSYDSLPALINTHITRAGQLFTSMFNNPHKLVFIHKRLFEITSMSYNYQVLLGYTGAQFPMLSHNRVMWAQKRSSEADGPPLESAEWDFTYVNRVFLQCRSPDRYVYTVVPVKVFPETAWDYRITYEAVFDRGIRQFLTILPDTGTITIDKDTTTESKSCTIKARVFEGRADSPVFTLKTYLMTWGRNPIDNPLHASALTGRTRLLFGEASRYALVANDYTTDKGTEIRVTTDGWTISDKEIITFYGNHSDKSRDVESNSCLIQAGYKEGTATLTCKVEWYHKTGLVFEWVPDGERTFTITVLNDQVQVIRQEIEPPMVGSGLSTSEIYLIPTVALNRIEIL
jgi:hypothetical protein